MGSHQATSISRSSTFSHRGAHVYKGMIFPSRGCLQEKSSEHTLFWSRIAASTGRGFCTGSHSKQQFWGWFQAALHNWVDAHFFPNPAPLAASHGQRGGWHHHLALAEPDTPGLSIAMGPGGRLRWVLGRIQTAPTPPLSVRTTRLFLDIMLTTHVQGEVGTEHLHVHRKPTKQPWDP